MTRLIEEEEAFKVLSAYYKHRTPIQDSALHEALSRVPTALSKRGHWIETDEWDDFCGRLYKCSNCKTFVIGDIDNYCPYCGADMRGEE